MATFRIPTPLRVYAGGQSEVPVRGSTVGEALDDLTSLYPALKPHLFSGEGQLRPFVNLFLAEENVKDLQGIQTPLQESDRLLLIPSIAGG
ncbi:MAG TPA: MoaD/ThiS family protein [Anaerolineales bacterium]